MIREKMVEYPPGSGKERKAVDLTQKECRELAAYYRRVAEEATKLEREFDALAEGARPD